MRKAVTPQPARAVMSLGLLALVLAACGGAPAGSPAGPTAAAPEQPTATPEATEGPATITPDARDPGDDTPAPPEGGEGASTGGTATVEIGGQTYELSTTAVCSLGTGVQASMASADNQASLDVYTIGSTGLINFARILEGEYWTPAGGQEAFVVSGSTATWSGAMSNLYGDGEQQVTIAITCDGGN